MFEIKDEISEAVDAVYAVVETMDRGDVLGHDAITEVLGLNPHEGRWGHIMRKVGRRLQNERGIAFWPNHRDGYKLCTTAEQLALPMERTRRGLRQVRRGRKSLEALPEKSLTMHQRRARLFMSARMIETESILRHEMKVQKKQVEPTQTIPRRPANLA